MQDDASSSRVPRASRCRTARSCCCRSYLRRSRSLQASRTLSKPTKSSHAPRRSQSGAKIRELIQLCEMNESQMFNDSSRQALCARLSRDRARRCPSRSRRALRPLSPCGPCGPCRPRVCIGAAEHGANVTDVMALNRKALRLEGPTWIAGALPENEHILKTPFVRGKSIDLLAPVARAERACYKRACASTWLHGLNLASR